MPHSRYNQYLTYSFVLGICSSLVGFFKLLSCYGHNQDSSVLVAYLTVLTIIFTLFIALTSYLHKALSPQNYQPGVALSLRTAYLGLLRSGALVHGLLYVGGGLIIWFNYEYSFTIVGKRSSTLALILGVLQFMTFMYYLIHFEPVTERHTQEGS